MQKRPYRVLMAKPGLDGHDRGAKVVARALRDAGFEVIYTGLHQTPDDIAHAAMQEDVDILGLSIHSGSHIPLICAVKEEMKKISLDKPIFVGGIIPDDDKKELLSLGVKAIFGPGANLKNIIQTVKQSCSERTDNV